MKKTLKIFAIVIVLLSSPIIALYLPPVQKWLTEMAGSYISKETGLRVTVESISLTFPLNLSLEGVKCEKTYRVDNENYSTEMLYAKKILVDVELLPLFNSTVNVQEMELLGLRLNTLELIAEARITGNVERAMLDGGNPTGTINLKDNLITLNKILLDGAKLNIILTDSTSKDTTESSKGFLIKAKELNISKSETTVYMPGDTLRAYAKIGDLNAKEITLDLDKGAYQVNNILATNSLLRYENTFIPHNVNYFDPNHILATIKRLSISNFVYSTPGALKLKINEGRITEQCGLDINSLSAVVSMDSTSLAVKGNIHTPHSKFYSDVDIEFDALDKEKDGHLRADIDAEIGRADIIALGGNFIPANLCHSIPAYPLIIRGSANGNMKELSIPNMQIDIPSMLTTTLRGDIKGITSLSDNIYSPEFLADVSLSAKTYNLSELKKLMPKETARSINLPPMTLDGDLHISGADYDAVLNIGEGKGKLQAKASVNMLTNKYNVIAQAKGIRPSRFLKTIPLYNINGDVKVVGQGFDITDKNTKLNLTADIRNISYDNYNLNKISTTANIANGKVTANVKSRNNLINGDIDLAALIGKSNFKTTITTDLRNIDLKGLSLVDVPLNFTVCGHMDIETDGKDYYNVNALLSDISIKDSAKIHKLDDIVVDIFTKRDTTAAHIYCGDFETRLRATGGYTWLLGCADRLNNEIERQMSTRIIDQAALREALPRADLYLKCGQDNPIHNSIKYWGIDFSEINTRLTTSRENGINGDLFLYGLTTEEYKIDTITANITSSNTPLDISYKIHVKNEKPNDYVFDVYADGNVLENGLSLNSLFYDDKHELGLKIGAEATMEENGLKFHLTPKTPVIAYEEFSLNDDNYVLLDKSGRIHANIKMQANDGTGIQIYSTEEDEDVAQDLTLSLNHLNIGKLLSAIPYAPSIEGMLAGDYHFIQEQDGKFSVSTDTDIHNMLYEGSNIGNIGTQMVYMPKEDGSHYVDGHIMLDDEEVGYISGSYNFDTDVVEAKMDFMRFPIALINGFIPDQIIGFEGFAEGELTIDGTTKKPDVNGELFLESASLISIPYGIRMRFDNDPVIITNSKLLFENFQMYASNDEPLIAQGNLDFSDTEHMKLNLRIKAENFLLINAKETHNSEAYGKAFVNFYCFINGELDKLNVRGKLDVLPSTNLYYILRDSPLTTDNRLKELVTFVDFNSEEPLEIVRPAIDGINIDLSITVRDGAHVKCWLNTDHSNYLDLIGGGDLRMKYKNENINLTGRYTIYEGEMKYSLPVIPLKTFTIASDSYVEFMGDVFNPRLNITATERVKSSCNIGGTDRLVIFDCGVIISKTLNDMGLQFIIEAPEEQTIKDQLTMMSAEERGKIAVTMLTTGMYLADGNTSDFSMNTALNSFLQSEINQIAGNALKTLDLSFGLENSTEEDGTMHTDYTFKFAKRFWNNRLSISVGGKISTGPDVSGQNKSFFDNVEAQYRFSDTSNQYANLFYKRSVYDYLEGYVGQYGAGYMYKKKLQRLSELFKPAGTITTAPVQRTNAAKADSVSNK